jgi:methylphosphotriester-DNA--protein-cysteine methyltransferase
MFHRLPIEPALQPFVHEIRVQGLDPSPAAPGAYSVLPGPFPVLGVRISGELRVRRTVDAATELLSASGITGLQDEPRWYVPQANTRSILVAFRPEGVFALFGVPMNELTNGELALDHLLPAADVRVAEERVASASGYAETGAAVTAILGAAAAAARSRPFVHRVIAASVDAILACQGNARIEQLAREASMSCRQLERLFREQVGMPPKRFAALTRFARAAAGLRRGIPLSQLALSAGYADQAHFSRAVRRFSGRSPRVLLAAADRGAVSQSFKT